MNQPATLPHCHTATLPHNLIGILAICSQPPLMTPPDGARMMVAPVSIRTIALAIPQRPHTGNEQLLTARALALRQLAHGSVRPGETSAKIMRLIGVQ